MKFLIIIPFLFSLIGCMKLEEKISDRSGGCVNGSCIDPHGESKPQQCLSTASKIMDFQGYKFKREQAGEAGVSYLAEYDFRNGNAFQYTQTCTIDENTWTQVVLKSDYQYNTQLKKLRFTTAGQQSSTFGNGKTCTAQLSSEDLKVSYEGMCLVLTNANGQPSYFVRE